jgi:alanyl-tRNA synthetase
LDRTPFYAESGGQVGDTGTITAASGTIGVLDTVNPLPGLHMHRVSIEQGSIRVGETVTAHIDEARRAAIRRNHTATHLLHWALREVLGDHVRQQGSLVGPDRLRFDFSHHRAVTDAEMTRIEDLVNTEILSNAPVEHFEASMDEATQIGAIAFFGEKYGEVVRVLRAGEHSIELCGGTHVSALGDIGLTKVVSEGSIGSNVRRIEAVTGLGSLELLRQRDHRLRDVAATLGVPTEDLADGMDKRLAELDSLRKEVRSLRRELADGASAQLAGSAVDGRIVARVDSERREDVRELAVALRDQPGVEVVVLGSSPGGKGVALVSAVTAESGLHAAELIADAAKLVGGGGGKAADLATAGGKLPEHLDEALSVVRERLGIA